MDYQGNYFPDDVDERESKIYRVIRKTFKYILYGLSAVVWVLIFVFIFVNRDSDIIEKNYMTEVAGFERLEPDEISLFRVNPREFMNEDGSIQVYNVDYAPDAGLLEMGIRFNARKLVADDGGKAYDDAKDKNGDVLEYVLKDSDGNVYQLVNKRTDTGGRYGFARICFSGVAIDLDSNDLNVDRKLEDIAMDATKDAPEEYAEYLRKLRSEYERGSDIRFILSVYYTRKDENGEELKTELQSFLIYNNDAVYTKTEYNEG